MLDHVSLQCADLAASSAFYEAVLAPLGVSRVVTMDDVVGFGIPPRPTFWVGRHSTGEGFRETHFAFAAPDRAAVQAFYDAAVAQGAEVLNAPQIRTEYHPSYFAAFVRDPDGNNVEAVCHRPE
jgi:catechol 2,3-dioxygenase-like lactoylglutathione lyase family enzyme